MKIKINFINNKIVVSAILSSLLPFSLMAKDIKNNQQKNTALFQDNSKIEKEFIKSVIPNTKLKKYKKSVIDGFYTIYLDSGNIIYVNPFKKLIFFGEIYTNNGFSITANERKAWQNEIAKKSIKDVKVDELLKDSFTMTFNKGSQNNYEFVIFTDPMCPYCKKLEKFLSTKDTTIHINFFPLDFHKGAKEISLKILSTKNPAKTFLDYKKNDLKNVKNIKITDSAKKKLEAMMSLSIPCKENPIL